MQFRITDSGTNLLLASRISLTRRQIADAQERVATGKRINRPSDDPTGAETLIRLRTAQAEIEHFSRNTSAVKERLTFSDSALDSYEQALDRVKALLMKGASGTASADVRATLAAEIDGVRIRVLANANTRIDGQYIFGGTRQAEPPFDPATAAASAVSALPTKLQIEQGGQPFESGVLAETVFADSTGTVFAMMTDVAAALRGTGDAATDEQNIRAALDRVTEFGSRAATARARVGLSLEAVEDVQSRHERNDYLLSVAAQNIEAADFVEESMRLVESNNALEATLRAASQYGRKTLIDMLG